MTVSELNTYLRSLHPVPEPSVDRIIIGKPDKPVSSVATAWLPYFETCREAWQGGADVLIAHEPSFYTHWDLDAHEGDFFDAPEAGTQAYLHAVKEKRNWLEHSGLAIIRCHDVLDALPEWGNALCLWPCLRLLQ